MSTLTGLGSKRKILCRAVNKGTRVGLLLRKPISMMFRGRVRKVTLVDGPALKSAAICGKIARLSRLLIHVSRRWSRSCMFFFRLRRCCRFDVLPDSRYSRYTREMVVRENPNFLAASKMLCSIFRAPTITLRWNSLKS
ncbi:uncharacterized protein TNCV_4017131 [Trichonephila clavipes]|nr:uncharacterized protein TNCV_4017131 [Trichonephila clavipes]